jgi:uncharacterized protein YndB with AHSA1/START domain
MDRSRLLRTALGVNAVFSLICGLAFLFFDEGLARFLSVPAGILAPVGGALLLWAGFVGWQTLRRRLSTLLALVTSLGDGVWVLGTIVGLAGWEGALTPSGVMLALGVAAVVAALAGAQLVGIRRFHAETDPDQETRWRVCVPVEVAASPEAMWPVVSDLGAIERFAPDLVSSEVDGPPEQGAVRRCRDAAGHTWEEECIAVEPGRSLELRFRTEAEGFPFPVTAMTGGWIVEPSGDGSRVSIWWSFDPRPSWAAMLMVPVMAGKLERDFRNVVGRMAAMTGEVSSAGSGGTRLAPAC